MLVVVSCGSCREVVPTRDAEICWFCGDDLCIGCHDVQGHCGHAVAHQINRLAAKGPVLQAELDRCMADHHGAETRAARKRLTA